MKRIRKLLKEQRGGVLIYVTLSMVVLLGFSAGVMDIGLLYENRRQLQNGADGAALAGAQELLKFELSAAEREVLAVNTALDYAQRNGVPISQIEPGYPQVTCVPLTYNGNCDPASEYYYNAVKMAAGRELDLLTAGLLGNSLGDVGANATAIIGPMLPTEGLWPWGVSPCNDWDWDGDEECDIPVGTPIILKFGAPPGSPGNFFPLDFPDSTGGAGYWDSIKYGYGHEEGDYIKTDLPWCGKVEAPGCTVQDDPYVQTETGNKVQPTRDGVDYLISQAAASNQDDPASSWNEPFDQCTWPGAPKEPREIPNLPDPPPPGLPKPPGWTGTGSPMPADWSGNASACYRVGIVPIIYQDWEDLAGHTPVDIIRWGAIYLIGRTQAPSGQTVIWGYYTDQATISGGRFSDTDTGLWGARLWE